MSFSLNKKIEEIRQKPEEVRLRYVWGMVAACMFFIVIIWIFSVKENFQSINIRNSQLPSVSEGLESLTAGMPEGNAENLPQSISEMENPQSEGPAGDISVSGQNSSR